MKSSPWLIKRVFVLISLVGLVRLGLGCSGNPSKNNHRDSKSEISRGGVEAGGVVAVAMESPAAATWEAKREDESASGAALRANAIKSAELIASGTYAFAASTGASLEDMSSGTTLLVAADQDDAASAVTPIGFDFFYDGVRQTQFSVNANGLMRLGLAPVSTALSNAITTTTNAPQIAPYWDDLWIGNNGRIHYKVVGSAPSRKLVVEWQNAQVPRVAVANAGAGTFQAWLWETSGVIEFVYGTGMAVNSTNGGYTVGLGTSATSFAAVTTSTGTVSYATANDTQTEAIAAGTKYTFTPNLPTTDPGTLTFTAVGLNTMTLNWTDGSSNEVGYAIYRSPDGVNYDFIRLTAANATSSVEAGLASNTLWYWKVVTVTEGAVSPASSANQATSAGTISGTKSVGPAPSDYTTIAAAIADINTNGLSGSVTLELKSTYVSTVETFPLVVNALGSPTNPITIRPETGATALSITSASTTATLDLNTATNVTIDGRAGGTGPAQLSIANTATAGSALRLIDGASRNVIKFCSLQAVNTSTTGGVVLFSTSSGVTGNNGNTLDSCDIRDGATTPVNGITSIGTAGTNTLNTGNTISNCNIFNFFSATVATNGILVTTNTNLSNTGWTIANNRIFQTAARTYTTGNSHRGILVNGGSSYTVSGNVIGFAAADGTGTYSMTGTVTTSFVGIQMSVGNAPSSIQGNTVSGISLGSNGAGTLQGINLGGGSANIGTTTGNTIGAVTGTGALQVTVAGAAGGVFIVGLNVFGTAAGTVVVSNNVVGSLTATGSTTLNANINALQLIGGLLTVTNNTVGSATTANSIQVTTTGASATGQQAIGMLIATTMPITIAGNTVGNLANAGTGTAHLVRGIQVQAPAVTAGASAGAATIQLNTVHDLSAASANTTLASGGTAVTGISHLAVSPYGASVDQNVVSAISATNAGAVATSAAGIGFANATNGSVTRNKIYDIRNASTGTTATTPPMAIGVLLRASPGSGSRVVNNMISLGESQTGNTQFVGIMISTATNAVSCHYNSVHIGGMVSTGALPSFGLLRGDNSAASAITTPVSVLDNIFNNTRTGGTGKHYAIGNVNSAPATGWVSASNYNVLNSAVASTVGIWGLTTDQTFTDWQTSAAGDGQSYSGLPVPFSAVATGDLHLACGTTGTTLESHGVVIPTVTIDYDNQSRPGPPGSVKGGGTAPDIGADEADCVPPAVCGDGKVGGSEQCDLGMANGQPGSCCSAMCQFATSATVCRMAAGTCDQVETCDGVSDSCPTDRFVSSGTPCRPVAGLCDVAESCSGMAAACPADQFVASGTVCRAAAGVCDVADTCTGSSATCVDAKAMPGTQCRPALGACDQAETCNGTSNACPADVLRPSTYMCKPAGASPICDPADYCDGIRTSCPASYAAYGTTCGGGSCNGLGRCL